MKRVYMRVAGDRIPYGACGKAIRRGQKRTQEGMVTVEVRLVKACAECGSEL